jgi:hypothetical protein
VPRASPSEGGPVSVPGTPLVEDGPVPTSGDSPRASAGHITPDPGQAEELVATAKPPSPETDWQKPITDYLQLGIMRMMKLKPGASHTGLKDT